MNLSTSKAVLFSFSLLIALTGVAGQENATKVSQSLGDSVKLQDYEFNDNKASWFVFKSETVTTLNLIDYNSFETGNGNINAKSVVLTTGRNNVSMRVSQLGGNQRVIAMANKEFIGIDNNVDSSFIGTVKPSGFFAGVMASGSAVLGLFVYLYIRQSRREKYESIQVL